MRGFAKTNKEWNIDEEPENEGIAPGKPGWAEQGSDRSRDAQLPENRASMADYLRQGVDVYFYRHDEVPDVPPVAIAVVQDPAYWIDCAESEDVAVLLATQLGLSVTRGIL